VRRDLAKRLEALETKAKPREISTWVDFMMCEDDEVELSPELQELVEMAANENGVDSEAKPELQS